MSNIMDLQTRSRVIHTFPLPAKLGGTDWLSLGFVELTAADEIQATKRARGDAVRLGFELAMQSLAEVNGKPVSLTDGSLEQAWNTMPPKVRTLALGAYQELHMPSQDDADLFIKGRQSRA